MRVLVTAASRHGGTSAVAEELARTLVAAGLEADLRPPDEVEDVREYDAIVLGSAIYYGQWLPTALDLVRRNRGVIDERPVWLFSVGPLGSAEPQAATEPAIVGELAERTHARGHRVFGGVLDRSRLGIGEKIVASVVRAPEGDFRDWPEVRRWASEIASDIGTARSAS